MMQNKKTVFIACFLFLCAFTFAILFSILNSTEEDQNPMDLVSVKELMFLVDMGFMYRERPETAIHYTSIELTLCEIEAYSMPLDVMAFWTHDFLLESIIKRLNLAISKNEYDLFNPSTGQPYRDVLTFEQFDLNYPLTVDELIRNWGKVVDLWFDLDRGEQISIGVGGR